jgi:hypothetical protein
LGRDAVDVGCAGRERKAGELAGVEPAVRVFDHRGRHRLHRDHRAGRKPEERRRRYRARRESCERPHRAVRSDLEQRIRARIGDDCTSRQHDHAERIAVGTARHRVVGGLERGDVGGLPPLAGHVDL